jgi:hypothetical protein
MSEIMQERKLIHLLLPAMLLCGCGKSDNSVGKSDATSVAVPDGQSTQAAQPAATPAFSETVTYNTISFTVSSPNRPQDNTAHLTSKGLSAVEIDEDIPVRGRISELLTGDIDSDNHPELVIVTKSGDNEEGTAYIYSSNNGKSISQVYLPELNDNPNALGGYGGYDEYAIGENAFLRRFPLFDGEKKSGTYREFQYRLVKGEASKILKLYNTVEF